MKGYANRVSLRSMNTPSIIKYGSQLPMSIVFFGHLTN